MSPLDVLSAAELDKLRAWKAAYMLQYDGWSMAEARRLVFARWLYQRGLLIA